MGSTLSKDAIALAPEVTSQHAARRTSQHVPYDSRPENGHSNGYQHHDQHETRDRSDNSIQLDRIRRLKEALRGEKNKAAVLAESYRKAQDEASELQKTCAALQLDLATCKHDLFSLQPCSQISDSEIADKVEHLSQQISQWSDEAFKDIDLMQQGLEENMLYEHEHFPIARSVDAESDEMFKHVPSAAEFFMHHVVFQHLQQRVFDEENYLFGLHPDFGAFLGTIENSMGVLEPKRDISVINKWRSETLLSIAAVPWFVHGLEEVVKAVGSSLKGALQDNFPILFFLDACFAKLLEKIVKPAVELAILIWTLPVRYTVTPQLTFPPLKDEQILFPTILDRAIAKDIETRKTLTLHSNIVVDKNGCIGDRVMITEPGLVRCGTNMQAEVVVRKPQMAVYLKEPLGRRQR
ncbi:hypothetical protein MMC17_003618 [Xylographa soralifera]|nr:hypothetical protein [Xylographa soralifera]